jgi:hypothetical protein
MMVATNVTAEKEELSVDKELGTLSSGSKGNQIGDGMLTNKKTGKNEFWQGGIRYEELLSNVERK